MPIEIKRDGDRYTAVVTPPHGRGERWASPNRMSASELVDALRELGCHTTDISDAMFEADPFWLNRVKEP